MGNDVSLKIDFEVTKSLAEAIKGIDTLTKTFDKLNAVASKSNASSSASLEKMADGYVNYMSQIEKSYAEMTKKTFEQMDAGLQRTISAFGSLSTKLEDAITKAGGVNIAPTLDTTQVAAQADDFASLFGSALRQQMANEQAELENLFKSTPLIPPEAIVPQEVKDELRDTLDDAGKAAAIPTKQQITKVRKETDELLKNLDRRQKKEDRLRKRQMAEAKQRAEVVNDVIENGGVSLEEHAEKAAKDLEQAFTDLKSGNLFTAMKNLRSAKTGIGASMAGADSMGGMAGILGKLTTVLTPLIGIMGGFVTAMLGAEKRASEISRTMAEGVGSTDAFVSHVIDGGEQLKSASIDLASDFDYLTSWGMKAEDIAGVMKDLSTSGAKQSDILKDSMGSAKMAFESAMGFAKAFGVTTGEIAKAQGELVADLNMGLGEVQTLFSQMNRDQKDTIISTNRFFASVTSASGAMDQYRQSVGEVSKLLGALGSSGIMGAKRAETILSDMTGHFAGLNQAASGTLALLAGDTELQAQGKAQLEDLQAQINAAETDAEKTRLTFIRDRLQANLSKNDPFSKGQSVKMLNIGGQLQMAMTAAFRVSGLSSSNDMVADAKAMLNDSLLLQRGAAAAGMDEEKFGEMMETAISAGVDYEKKTGKKMPPKEFAKYLADLDKKNATERLKKEAKEFQQRMTPLTDLIEIGVSAILMDIFKFVYKIWKAVSLNLFKSAADRALIKKEDALQALKEKRAEIASQKSRAVSPEDKKLLAERMEQISKEIEAAEVQRDAADYAVKLQQQRMDEGGKEFDQPSVNAKTNEYLNTHFAEMGKPFQEKIAETLSKLGNDAKSKQFRDKFDAIMARTHGDLNGARGVYDQSTVTDLKDLLASMKAVKPNQDVKQVYDSGIGILSPGDIVAHGEGIAGVIGGNKGDMAGELLGRLGNGGMTNVNNVFNINGGNPEEVRRVILATMLEVQNHNRV